MTHSPTFKCRSKMIKICVLLIVCLSLAVEVQNSYGSSGEKGQKGETGVSGQPGQHGVPGQVQKGERGQPGYDGERGQPGQPGLPGQGQKGERGQPGYDGERGQPGQPGLPGQGQKGERGHAGCLKGEMGSIGQPGRPGYQGPPGVCEPNQCPKGKLVQPEQPDVSGTRSKRDVLHSNRLAGGILLVKHSQSSVIPICPDNGMTKLWDGFSFGSSQDFGSTGSCLRRFVPVPRAYCSEDAATCDNFDQDDTSIWLSSNTEVSNSNSLDNISRCIVCAASFPIITVHSQTVDTPSCPAGWIPLWNGYSFAMHKSGSQNHGQSLTSLGSCLETFSPSVLMECSSTEGTCRLLDNKFNYWLNADESDSVVKTLPQISRCSVCMQGLN